MPKVNAIQVVILCALLAASLWRRIRCATGPRRRPTAFSGCPWRLDCLGRRHQLRIHSTTPAFRTSGTAARQSVWQGHYQLCHDSAQAYGDVLAPMIGATLTKFACTGSTYENGIAFDRRYDGALYRPAQFGNWLGMTNLNAAYDAAQAGRRDHHAGRRRRQLRRHLHLLRYRLYPSRGGGRARQGADRSRQLRANFVNASRPWRHG